MLCWCATESASGGSSEGLRLQIERQLSSVEQAILPHLDAAYNLARWLTATDQDAEDVVQEACLRDQILSELSGW